MGLTTTSIGRVLARLVAALLVLNLATAQEASGLVLGFDGQPVAGAVVMARAQSPEWQKQLLTDGNGRFAIAAAGPLTRWMAPVVLARTQAPEWHKQLLTDANGRFAIAAVGPLTRLTVQLEGVVRDIALTDGRAPAARVSFVGAPHTTLRGRILTPDGLGARNVDVLCRDGGGSTLVNVTTSDDGSFAVRLGEPAKELRVDPLGWQHVVDGPLANGEDQTLDVRLDGTRFFALQGRVIGTTGPLADTEVKAQLQGGGIVTATSARDGRYTLWTDRPVAALLVPGADPMHRPGPFAAAATAVDLDAREHGLVLVVGRVVDRNGEGAVATTLYGVERGGPPTARRTADATTDGNGWFRMRLPRSQRFVYAYREGGDRKGWAEIPADGKPFEVQIQ